VQYKFTQLQQGGVEVHTLQQGAVKKLPMFIKDG
jgi:hypothetical protein